MLFADLQNTLLNVLRTRIRNGELTERGLAKLTGVSQPHIHNVLKGVRILSLDLADRLLSDLHLSVTDLVSPVEPEAVGLSQYAHLPVLKGKIGPESPWPTVTDSYQRFPICLSRVTQMQAPMAACLGFDPKMASLFSDGDFSILDQTYLARTFIDPEAYYAVKRGLSGCIRKLRLVNRKLHLLAEEPVDSEIIELKGQPVQHYVRARITFITTDIEWKS